MSEDKHFSFLIFFFLLFFFLFFVFVFFFVVVVYLRLNTTCVSVLANCDAGFFSPTNSLPCFPCPVGTYKDTVGNSNCTLCIPDLTTEGSGSTSPSQCTIGEFRRHCYKCVQ